MGTEDADKRHKAVGDLAEISRESYRTVVDRTFAARESSARVTRSFFEDTVEELHEQTESNRRAMEELAEQMRRQSSALLELSRDSLESYEGFLDSLTSYYEDSTGEKKP